MSMMKIKKGDTVKVIAGKDKDKEGKVISVDAKNHKVVVEGVNMMTKHAKPSQANPNGGIVQTEAALDISNVMYVPDETGKEIKMEILFTFEANENKYVIFKKFICFGIFANIPAGFKKINCKCIFLKLSFNIIKKTICLRYTFFYNLNKHRETLCF